MTVNAVETMRPGKHREWAQSDWFISTGWDAAFAISCSNFRNSFPFPERLGLAEDVSPWSDAAVPLEF